MWSFMRYFFIAFLPRDVFEFLYANNRDILTDFAYLLWFLGVLLEKSTLLSLNFI
jgi:hypothetical protein